MNPESQAWQRLREVASARLSPGFADAVLSASRLPPQPSFARQLALGAAAAAVCFLAVLFYELRTSGADRDRVLDGWQQIISENATIAYSQ